MKIKKILIKDEALIKEIKEHVHIIWNEILELKIILKRLKKRSSQNQTTKEIYEVLLNSDISYKLKKLQKEHDSFIIVSNISQFCLNDIDCCWTQSGIKLYNKIISLLGKESGESYEWI